LQATTGFPKLRGRCCITNSNFYHLSIFGSNRAKKTSENP